MGGLPVQEDIAKFKKDKKVHILVGSPGRLRHLVHDKHIDISSVRLLVFDEADKLMEKSFQADINYIFSVLPKQKQVIMSSATYPDNAKQFISHYVQNAQHICPDSDSILLGIEQKITYVKHNSNIVRQTKLRFEELLKILSKKQFKQCLIFCNYQARVTELHKMLNKEQWPAEQLYGQQEQTDRLDALKTLQEYKCRILISTDLAARGIDASNVDLVINFEPPFEWQTYLHRIGRAGRFGSFGIAVTIVSEGKEQKKFIELLHSINGSVNLENLWTNEELDIVNPDDASLQYPETKTEVHTSLPVNTKLNHKYELLWKMYTSEPKEQSKLIESFEELCISFEKNKDREIQSFTDLLSSFQTYEANIKNDDADNEYCHLKMPMIPVTEYFTSIYHSHKFNFCDTKKLYNTEKVCNGNQEAINVVETLKEKHSHMNIFRNKEHLDTTKHKEEQSDYELENTDSLANAGLPIAFSSSKYSNHKDKNKGIHITGTEDYNTSTKSAQRKYFNKQSYRTINADKNLNYNVNHFEGTKRSGFNNKKFEPKVKSSKVQVESDDEEADDNDIDYDSEESDDSEDNGYNTLSQQYRKSQSNTNSAKSSKKGMQQSFTNYRSQYHNYESAINSYGLNHDYTNWYKQLKFRVKQIELAVYVDEMSRL